MTNKIYIFESHPVQYKAPVYREINRILPGAIEVIYASDFSVRAGSVDRGFGVEVNWDIPLLSGYDYRVLGNGTGIDYLSGKGVFQLLKAERPRAVVLTHTRYQFDHAAYLGALLLGIPILIRQETQDETHARTRLKSVLRYLAYRLIYAPVKHAFCFGKLNRSHLLRHGIHPDKISTAHFSVANPLKNMSDKEKWLQRTKIREKFNITPSAKVVSFFGKLIPRKNPDIILRSLAHVKPETRKNLHILFVGSGELEESLILQAAELQQSCGVKTSFSGFINQQALHGYYLASDIVCLPSRREAWGLVINEALDAGNAVIMTDPVGCRLEFGSWERARIVPDENPEELARAITELSAYERSLDWATPQMEHYSTEAAARDMAEVFKKYIGQS